jgi:hypothetical protein
MLGKLVSKPWSSGTFSEAWSLCLCLSVSCLLPSVSWLLPASLPVCNNVDISFAEHGVSLVKTGPYSWISTRSTSEKSSTFIATDSCRPRLVRDREQAGTQVGEREGYEGASVGFLCLVSML